MNAETRPAPWWEGALVLAASWTLSLGRPTAYYFSGDATTFLRDAAAFPTTATLWDLCYPTPAVLFHGPLTGLCLVPITRLPVDTLAHLMIWAGLVGLAPVILWMGLRRELPRAALPVALGLIVSPAFSLGIRHFSSPGVMPLFLALAVGPLLVGHRRGSTLALAGAGVGCGLAAASHLEGLLLLPPLVAATWPWRGRPAAWIGVGAFLVLAAATNLPPIWTQPHGLFLIATGTGVSQLLSYSLVLVLGGLLPAAVAIFLTRWRLGRTVDKAGFTPWREALRAPAWWMLATGAALMLYLSLPEDYVYPHYFDVAILGLLLVLAPKNPLERWLLLGVFGLALGVQLVMLAAYPLDDQYRYHVVIEDTLELCEGRGEIPDPEVRDPRPYLYMMERMCPEVPRPAR